MNCFRCGETFKLIGEKITPSAACERCRSPVHVCKNCCFFDPAVKKECREPKAEWQRYKDRANSCDYFEPRESVDLTRKSGAAVSADDARKKFDQLFKK